MTLALHMLKFSIISISMLLVTAFLLPLVTKAEPLSLSQRIVPVECVVSVVNTGSGSTTTYSDMCGPVIPTPTPIVPGPAIRIPTDLTSARQPSNLRPVPEAPVQLEPNRRVTPVYINDIPAVFSSSGVIFEIALNGSLSFRLPSDNLWSEARKLTYASRLNSGIVLLINPGQNSFGLREGEIRLFDIDGDNQKDMRVELHAVSGQGFAYIRIAFLSGQGPRETARESDATSFLTVAIIGTGITVNLLYRRYHTQSVKYWVHPHFHP